MIVMRWGVAPIIFLALTGYILLCGYLYLRQESFLFHPTKLAADHPYTFAADFTEINLQVDGALINAVHLKAAEQGKSKGVILYLHGNGDIIPFLERVAAYYIGLGYDVFIPDYRGYGKSTGTIVAESELISDMQTVYEHLRDEYLEEEIVIYGQSLGSGLAVTLAAEYSPRILILESPYFSMVDLIRTRLPFIPSFLVKYQMRSDKRIEGVRCPTYIIHGTEDRVIPITQGERLYEMVRSTKEFLPLSGAGHGSLLHDRRLRQFLERVLL